MRQALEPKEPGIKNISTDPYKGKIPFRLDHKTITYCPLSKTRKYRDLFNSEEEFEAYVAKYI